MEIPTPASGCSVELVTTPKIFVTGSAACAGAVIDENPATALNKVIAKRIKRALILLLAKFKSRSTSVYSASPIGCSRLFLGA
jgi:hypothetical protein